MTREQVESFLSQYPSAHFEQTVGARVLSPISMQFRVVIKVFNSHVLSAVYRKYLSEQEVQANKLVHVTQCSGHDLHFFGSLSSAYSPSTHL